MCYYFAYIAAETHISAIMVFLQDAVDPPFRPACVCVYKYTCVCTYTCLCIYILICICICGDLHSCDLPQ